MTDVTVDVISPQVSLENIQSILSVQSVGGQGLEGPSAYQVAVDNGFVGDEAAWLTTLEGISAYQVAVNNGFIGTEAEWLTSIEGASAYEVAVAAGFVGDETAWLTTLEGLSAYEVAVANGFVGDEAAWLASLDGVGIPAAGTAGQVISKVDGTDYNVEWADPVTGLPNGTDNNFVTYSTALINKGTIIDNSPLVITCNNTTWGSTSTLKVDDGGTHKVGGIGNWVMFDFVTPVTLYSWVMHGHSTKYIASLRWEYSDDGTAFTEAETFSGLGVGPYELPFADQEQNHRYWRYVLLAGSGEATSGEVDYVAFYPSEITGAWVAKTPAEVVGILPIGPSLPVGGTVDQVLTKQSATDGDAAWADPTLPPSNLNDLTDVNAGTPTDTQALIWDAATNKWIAGDVASGSTGSLFAEDIGAVTANIPVTVTHNLGTMDVIVEVFEKAAAGTGAAAGDVVEPQVTLVDANSLELTFAEDAVADLYRVVISSGSSGGSGGSVTFYAYSLDAGNTTASNPVTNTSSTAYSAMTATLSSAMGTPITIHDILWKGANAPETFELFIDGVSYGTQTSTTTGEDLLWSGIELILSATQEVTISFVPPINRTYRYNTTGGPLTVNGLIFGDWAQASANTIAMDVVYSGYSLAEITAGGGGSTSTPDSVDAIIAGRMFG